MTDRTELKHPEAIMEFLSVFTGDSVYKDLELLISREKEKGAVINMCWVAQNLIEEGRMEGKIQGVLQTLNSLVMDKVIGLEEAAGRAGMTKEEYVRAVEELAGKSCRVVNTGL